MAGETPATRALRSAGIPFITVRYAYDPAVDNIGLAAAKALDVPPSCMFKTLMMQVDGLPARALLASDRVVSMKMLAMAAGGKSAVMMPPGDAERMTGYKVGGISPFGSRRAVPTYLDSAVTGLDRVFVNGGQRGLQICLTPHALIAATQAMVVSLTA